MFDRIVRWLKYIIGSTFSKKPPITFPTVTIVERTPRNHEVKSDIFYVVGTENKPKWAMFLCPCGCRYVITLSLKKVHNPHWALSLKPAGRPSLYPSVWQNTACYSHFWLTDGRIFWCNDKRSSADRQLLREEVPLAAKHLDAKTVKT